MGESFLASAQPQIISASRRTDLPRYFSRWFSQRRREGFAVWRNCFGGSGRVSLRREDVLGYLFWTRDARPLLEELKRMRSEEIPCAFQYTITSYGRELEPYLPRWEKTIENFWRVRDLLPSPDCLQWRYDPIVFSSKYNFQFHRQTFFRLANELAGATRVVNISLIEPYFKTLRRMQPVAADVHYRQIDEERKQKISRRFPSVTFVNNQDLAFIAELNAIAQEHRMTLRICAQPDLPWPAAQCCGDELFKAFGESVENKLKSLKVTPTRPGCRCLASVDIGMDNTCLSGCRYCYTTASHQVAVKNRRQHDPQNEKIR